MAFEISSRLRRALSQTNIRPSIVLEFISSGDKFATAKIERFIRVGEPDLVIGDSWVIGGSVELENLDDVITFDGTSTSIRQNLEIDKAASSSISSLVVSLADDGTISRFISPGFDLTDVLAEKVIVWAGAEGGTSFPEDYFVVFRGTISTVDAGQGKVTFTIAGPENNLRGSAFAKGTSKLAATLSDSATTSLTISSDDISNFIPVLETGDPTPLPSAPPELDDVLTFSAYVKINDEIIKYSYARGAQLFTLTRGQFGTTPASHAIGDDVETIFEVGGNPIFIALNLLGSSRFNPAATYLDSGTDLFTQFGRFFPYAKQAITSVNFIKFGDVRPDTLFFKNVDLTKTIGINLGAGTIVIIKDSTSNNAVQATISSVLVDDFGTYLTMNVTSGTLVEAELEDGDAYFYSVSNQFVDGAGLDPSEIDVDQFIEIIDKFLNFGQYKVRFFLRDTIDNLKDWIERELYLPFGCYSIPRNAQASLGFTSPPFPGEQVPIIDERHVVNPSGLVTKRSTAKYFYNSVITKYNDSIDSEDFTKAVVVIDEDSRNQIKINSKPLIIESRGYKDGIAAAPDRIRSISQRILSRYKFAAQYIERIRVVPEIGYNIEVGDKVLIDGRRLGLLDTASGARGLSPRLFEVVNKSIDLKTLNVEISVLDTNFDPDNRYALVSPSSRIRSRVSSTSFVIEAAFSTVTYGLEEFKKWEKLFNPNAELKVRVRRPDWSQDFTTSIASISGNQITVSDTIPFTVQRNDILEFADYNDTSAVEKALYGFMRDEPGFDDMTSTYKMF